jgi:hypothetical protein
MSKNNSSKNNSSQNNLNNKFGECCGCPALVNDDRLFNNYVSSRLRNDQIRKSLNITDSHTYRSILQTASQNFIGDDIKRIENSRCKSNDKNKFYIDSSKYNFDKPLTNGYWGLSIENDGIKQSQITPIKQNCTGQNVEHHRGKRYQINPDKNC